METRANYVAIGAFVLIVIIGALSSLYWLYRSSETGATETVRIIFPEPVTGLSSGGSVLFNGIKVGEVTSLEFPQGGGDNVIALTRLNPSAPIKVDTVAKLGFQGLTGIAYISLTGGSRNAKSLFEATADDRVPTIVADTSAFTNVLDTAQSVLARMNSTLDEVNGILRDNRDDVNVVVANVRTLSQAFADSAPQISGLITDIASAARSIATAVPQVTGTFERANTLLGAIEPDRVGSIVANVENFTAQLPAIGEQAGQIVGNVNGLVTRLDDAAGTLGEAIRAAGNVVAAVNQDEIAAIVSNIKTATDTFAAKSAEIGTFIDNASVISTDVREVTAVVAERKEAIATALDNATTLISDVRGAVNAAVPAIENLGKAIAAVTPDRITAVVANVERFTSTLANQSDGIATFVTAATDAATSINDVATGLAAKREVIDKAIDDAGTLVANLSTASADIPGIIQKVNDGVDAAAAVIKAVDANAINAVVRDAGTFASALAEQSGHLAGIVTNVEGITTHAQSIAAALDGKMPQVGTIIDNAEAVTVSARTFADRLPQMADALQPGIENLSAVLSSIDSEAVSGAVAEAANFVHSIAQQAEPIAAIVASAKAAAADVEAISKTVAQHTPQIETILTNASTASENIAAATKTLEGLANDAAPAVRQLIEAVNVVTPARVDGIVTGVETLVAGVSSHTADVEAIIVDARATAASAKTLAATLEGRAPQIGQIVDDAAATVADARTAAAKVPGLVDSLQPGIENLSAVLSAVDQQAVKDIITDAKTLAAALAEQAPRIAPIVANVEATVSDVRAFTEALATKRDEILALVDDARATVASARTAADGLPKLVAALQPGVDNIAAVLSAIDQKAIEGIVADVKSFTAILSAQGPTVGEIIQRIDRTTGDANAILGRLRGQLDTITSGLSDARAALADARIFAAGLPEMLNSLQPGVANLSDTLQTIDPAAIDAIITNVRDVSGTLSALRGDITQVVTTASNAAQQIDTVATAVSARTEAIGKAIENVAAFTGNLADVGPKVSGIIDTVGEAATTIRNSVAAIDAAQVNSILANVQKAAAAVGSRAGEIGTAIDNAVAAAKDLAEGFGSVGGEDGAIKEVIDKARRIATNLETASSKIGDVVGKADSLFDGPVQRLVTDVSDAATSVKTVAAAFASRAQQIAGGLAKFSQGGLDDLRALIDQGRSTLSSIERAVSSFDRNPSRVIFGGSEGPRYTPQRR